MANKQAAIKYLRKTKKRNAKNISVKTNIKKQIKEIRKAIDAGDYTKAEDALKKTIKLLDKAGQNKVLKKNTVGRKKSRLAKAVRASKTSKK